MPGKKEKLPEQSFGLLKRLVELGDRSVMPDNAQVKCLIRRGFASWAPTTETVGPFRTLSVTQGGRDHFNKRVAKHG
jgi:hypothetical protein